MLLEQFGGGNGELKAAVQYFVQAFSRRQPFPDKYNMLMDIATEEFSHLEIVGATIQMLLGPIPAELKDATLTKDLGQKLEESGLSKLTSGSKGAREEFIHQAMVNPAFLVHSPGPQVTNSVGVPWSGVYVNANGDLSVDLRSDIAAESRAKLTYEFLMQFTDDPHVKQSLAFLTTREITHMQVFTAALATVQPNFPPALLEGNPEHSHTYFNMSNGVSARGLWNQGKGPWNDGREWQYIEDPVEAVRRTNGLLDMKGEKGRSLEEAERRDQELGRRKSEELKQAVPEGENQWSAFPQTSLESPRLKRAS